MGKLKISEVNHGVEFLGSYIRPWRTYVSRKTLVRIEKKVKEIDCSKPSKALRSVNSYLGILHHTSSYRIRRKLFLKSEFLKIGIFDRDMTKLTDRRRLYKKKTRWNGFSDEK